MKKHFWLWSWLPTSSLFIRWKMLKENPNMHQDLKDIILFAVLITEVIGLVPFIGWFIKHEWLTSLISAEVFRVR